MKRNIVFLLLTLMGIMVTIFFSCQKGSSNLLQGEPSIYFKNGAGYLFEDATIKTNEEINVGIISTMNNNTKKPLRGLSLMLVSDDKPTILLFDTAFNLESYSNDYRLRFLEPGNFVLAAKVEDEANQSSAVSFLLIIEFEEPLVGFPSIDFKDGTDYTSEDVTITTNDDILVGIMAALHTETKKALTNFRLELVSETSTNTLVDSAFNAEAFNADYLISFSDVGQLTLNAKITDEDNRSEEASFQITVEEGGVKVKKNADLTLGSWNDPIGSFYDTQNEAVYTNSSANENQETVDFIFFKGTTNQNTFAAPDDQDVNTIETFQLDDWTVKNATRFMMTDMDAAAFDAIDGYHIFPEFTGNDSKSNNLENGDVVFFKTEAGKHGYIKVVDLYSRGDLADFEVIIEE